MPVIVKDTGICTCQHIEIRNWPENSKGCSFYLLVIIVLSLLLVLSGRGRLRAAEFVVKSLYWPKVRDRAKFRVRIVDRFSLQLGIKLVQELQLELEVRLVLDLV